MSVPRQKPGLSKQDYQTPTAFIVAVKKQLLHIDYFDFDFAADEYNTQSENYWTERDDSLLRKSVDDWQAQVADGWGWLNPPYSNIAPWVQRCAEVQRRIAVLVPASVGSNWFRDCVNDMALVLFLNGRLSFDGVGPYPKDLMLILYGMMPGYQVWNWRDDA